MAELDLDTVRHALGVARTHGFAEVELSLGEDSFTARLIPGNRTAPASERHPAEEAAGAGVGENLVPVKASLVGYYQEGPVPLRVGMTVARGDVVAVIAALGLENDVEATVEGEIVEVLIEPDQPVEYGQALAMVRTK